LVEFCDGIDAGPEEDRGVLEISNQIPFLSFSFIFLVVLMFELRASCLLGRHSNNKIPFLVVATHEPGVDIPNSVIPSEFSLTKEFLKNTCNAILSCLGLVLTRPLVSKPSRICSWNMNHDLLSNTNII
jgi:hypothetical protein